MFLLLAGSPLSTLGGIYNWPAYTSRADITYLKNFKKALQVTNALLEKLDGVGPVDNRASSDKLHHFVKIRQGRPR